VLERGHAAGLMSIQAAAQKIALGELDVAISGGVDSYINQETLEWLDARGLLISEQNRNGFVPGEAAGVCIVTTRRTADDAGLPVHATVVAASTAHELNGIRGDGVCTGQGLTTAISEASASLRLPEESITATYCDLNGERYRNEELVYALLRVQRSFVNANDYESPADCWGDVGAASGPLFAGLAVSSGMRGYAKGLYPVLWCGSESGYRTAVVLRLGSN